MLTFLKENKISKTVVKCLRVWVVVPPCSVDLLVQGVCSLAGGRELWMRTTYGEGPRNA